MQVKDLMTTAVVTVSSRTTIAEATRLMLARRVSGLPVVGDTGELVGMLSEGDFLRRVELGTWRRPMQWLPDALRGGESAKDFILTRGLRVGDVMSHTPVTTVPGARLEDAVSLMQRHRIKRLPVLDGGKLIGILTRADFVRALAALVAPSYEEPATSDLEIAERIHDDLRVQPWALNSHVVVRVDRGHVELRGRALDEDQRDAARVLAENVAGVQSVVNDIVCDAPSIWSETDG